MNRVLTIIKLFAVGFLLSLLLSCSKQKEEYIPIHYNNAEMISVWVSLEDADSNNLLTDKDLLQTIQIYGKNLKRIPYELSENNQLIRFIPFLPDYRDEIAREVKDEYIETFFHSQTTLSVKGQKITLDSDFVHSAIEGMYGGGSIISKVKIGEKTFDSDMSDINSNIIIPLVYQNGKISVK